LKGILGNRGHNFYEIKEAILKELGRILASKSEQEIPACFMEIALSVEIDTKHLEKNLHEEKVAKI
jgi:hypothetical protein